MREKINKNIMEVIQIKKVDLRKILVNRGMTLYGLSKVSKVPFSYLLRANKGYCRLSAEAYKKIKPFL